MVGAVLQQPARAQDTTRVRRDTLQARRDSARAALASVGRDTTGIDSLAPPPPVRARADSIQAPLARAEFPILTDIGPGFQYDRYSIPATGAQSLGELLDRVPGVTIFRTGWIASPHLAALMGDFGRVRVFYDGVEVDALDPRNGGIPDLSTVEMWQMEGARIERGANEIRVHLRTWRRRSVTPETRVDIGTGDLETNTYRGYFARRYRNGLALQAGAQQYSTQDQRNKGDISQTSMFGRVGWARGRLSIDATYQNDRRDRAEQLALKTFRNLPQLETNQSLGYARIGWGDPDVNGVWAQATAATQKFIARHPDLTVIDSISGAGGGGPGGSATDPDTLTFPGDSVRSRSQYIAAAGWNRGAIRASLTARYRAQDAWLSPMGRVSWEKTRFALAAIAEDAAHDSLTRVEVSGRVLPTSFLALGGAVSRFTPKVAASTPASLSFRGEVGLRLGRLWATGGVMVRDSALLRPPVVLDTLYRARVQAQTKAVFTTLRGKIWKDVGVEMFGVRYNEPSAYRPQYQTRSELYLNTSWPSRFPSGNLNIMLAVTHEYRSGVIFPRARDNQDDEELLTPGYRVWGAMLEIKLLSATLTYQYRNLYGERYQQVPGLEMPRPTNVYGVRWYFLN